jgi:uncharacterized protein YegL
VATASKSKSKTNVLNVAFVWDMSGSMLRVNQATKDGTLAYLRDLQTEEAKLIKKAKGKGVFTRLSVTAFDTIFEQWAVNEPLDKVNVEALVGRYQPRGFTALYDAIANTITQTEMRMRTEEREEEKVLVIIMTDGGENASVEYNRHAGGRERILELIKSYEAKGNWTFVWLGAGEEALAEAEHLGMAAGNTASYVSTDSSVAVASASLASVTRSRRAGAEGQTVTAFADAGAPLDYTDVDGASDSRKARK